jgi:hypothetical protein
MLSTYFPPFSGHEKRAQLFCKALWIAKVNFLVKKLDAMELNNIYVQEIDPRLLDWLSSLAST